MATAAQIRGTLEVAETRRKRGLAAFKGMIADMKQGVNAMQHRNDVPYMLELEVSCLKATIEGVEKRISETFDKYNGES